MLGKYQEQEAGWLKLKTFGFPSGFGMCSRQVVSPAPCPSGSCLRFQPPTPPQDRVQTEWPWSTGMECPMRAGWKKRVIRPENNLWTWMLLNDFQCFVLEKHIHHRWPGSFTQLESQHKQEGRDWPGSPFWYPGSRDGNGQNQDSYLACWSRRFMVSFSSCLGPSEWRLYSDFLDHTL